jgi:hypothetical protein
LETRITTTRRIGREKIESVADAEVSQLAGGKARREHLILWDTGKILRKVIVVHPLGNLNDLTGGSDPTGRVGSPVDA